MRASLGAFLLALLVVACGGEDAPGVPDRIEIPEVDGGGVIDGGGGGTPDAGGGGMIDAGATTGSPVGTACMTADDCTGMFCISEDMGFPMGYCSALGCDLGSPDTSCLAAGGDGICLDVGDPMSPLGVCFDQCDPAAPDCRDGYSCQDFGFTAICLPAAICGDGVVDPGEECDPPNGTTCDDMCQGTGAAPVGAPCLDAAECSGDFCIAEADGWAGGYCTELDCDLSMPATSCAAFGGDATCVDVSDPADMMPFGACLDACDAMAPDCRPGYECTTFGAGTATYCLPGGSGGGMGVVGAACTTVTDCMGDFCINDPMWPGGYCVLTGCDLANPTTSCAAGGGDGYCIDTGDPGMPFGVCFDACDPMMSDCRMGYDCVDFGAGQAVCVPGGGGGGGGGMGVTGDACMSTADCMGNFCATDADGWPGGYCLHTPCTDDASCAVSGGDAVCINAGGTFVCLDDCAVDSDCRMGYTCTNFGMGNRACTP